MRPLRFGLFLEQPIEVGGGFQQPLNEVLWVRQWASETGNEIIVFTPFAKTVELLATFGIEARVRKPGIRDHLFLLLKYFGPFDLAQIYLRLLSSFETALLKNGIDVVYFLSPSKWHLILYRLPFIFTVFDGCHRDTVEFEEVRAFGEFERREFLFRSAVTKATLIVTNAPQISEALCRRYGMDPDRAICIPFSPSTFIAREADGRKSSVKSVLAKYQLEGGYLFYPAQFWHHKNHSILLAALKILRDRNVRKRVVFCGSDRGARTAIDKLVTDLELADQVSILGFVASSDLFELYQGATALVMPSYFGPTNLPPLEAWMVGTPVVYPEAFRFQVGDAAILFDYDDPLSLADAILRVDTEVAREKLREAGQKRLEYFEEEVKIGREQFSSHMARLKNRLIPRNDRLLH